MRKWYPNARGQGHLQVPEPQRGLPEGERDCLPQVEGEPQAKYERENTLASPSFHMLSLLSGLWPVPALNPLQRHPQHPQSTASSHQLAAARTQGAGARPCPSLASSVCL